MLFVDRERELAELERFWAFGRAERIPVIRRRRVGKADLRVACSFILAPV